MFALLGSLLRLLVSHPDVRDIALENLALGQQIAVFKRKCPRPRLRAMDCLFLGVAAPELEGLAPGVDHGETGNGCSLASQGLWPVLDLDFQAQERTPGVQPRH